jgi:hypothetical protein
MTWCNYQAGPTRACRAAACSICKSECVPETYAQVRCTRPKNIESRCQKGKRVCVPRLIHMVRSYPDHEHSSQCIAPTHKFNMHQSAGGCAATIVWPIANRCHTQAPTHTKSSHCNKNCQCGMAFQTGAAQEKNRNQPVQHSSATQELCNPNIPIICAPLAYAPILATKHATPAAGDQHT